MSDNPNPWLLKDGLRVGHLNVNHVISKITEISSILTNSGKNFHIFGCSESRLSSAISDSDISLLVTTSFVEILFKTEKLVYYCKFTSQLDLKE